MVEQSVLAPSRPSTSNMGIRISAAIITRNEERNIARSIESLRCCDEILVLDS